MYKEQEKSELTQKICLRISEGKALRNVLKQDKQLPSAATFFTWVNENDEILKQYMRACEERAALMFDEIKEIADNSGDDLTVLEDGREVINHAVINRDRLRVDSRKWMLSKLQPKKYGDKLELDTKISDGTEASESLASLSPEALLKVKNIIENDKLKE